MNPFGCCSSQIGIGYRLDATGVTNQHPMVPEYKGETCANADSCFFSEHGIGVADGVSGVSKRGIDPSLMPSELMRNAHMATVLYHDQPNVFERQVNQLYASHDLPLPLSESGETYENVEEKFEISSRKFSGT